MNTPKDTAKSSKACAWCGKTLIRPRSNQTYCNAECRKSHKHAKKGRNSAVLAVRKCQTCGSEFEPKKNSQEFCSTQCQQTYNNFWRSWGPRLAQKMNVWRIERKKGGMTEACREYSHANKLWKEKQKEMKK